jgi:hypothetical protein
MDAVVDAIPPAKRLACEKLTVALGRMPSLSLDRFLETRSTLDMGACDGWTAIVQSPDVARAIENLKAAGGEVAIGDDSLHYGRFVQILVKPYRFRTVSPNPDVSGNDYLYYRYEFGQPRYLVRPYSVNADTVGAVCAATAWQHEDALQNDPALSKVPVLPKAEQDELNEYRAEVSRWR